MRTRVLTLLAAATVAVAAPATASAATVIGGFSAGLVNVTSSTAAIGADSTFSNSGSAVLGSSGDLSTVGVFTPFTTSSVTATKGADVTFSALFGSFSGKVASIATGLNYVTVYTLGDFIPAASSGYDAGKASIAFTFNQAGGAGSDISGSFSFASPPSGVPEPATWGMMIAGAAMAGAAVRRRRASTKVAAA
ncbi:PEPxxWA-CTERM sorting domain-containing protein [Sphingomonas sp.]|uniref:PEPxxWA-CTERM sorting domain-containing protein n=1 Tax=Sphingomonas sp. TaxID=28214 RepID=UPI002FD90C19